MTKFHFYEKCTFCRSRIGSKHCLLPYQFVRQYNPPEDELSMIIDITEIHTRYGVEQLEANLNLSRWIKARAESIQGSMNQSSTSIRSEIWSEQIEDSNELLNVVGKGSITGDIFFNDSSDSPDEVTGIQDNDTTSGVPLTPEPVNLTAAQVVQRSETVSEKRVATPIDLNESHKEGNVTPTLTRPSSVVTASDAHNKRENHNHLIQDLAMIAKTAFNLNSLSRGWIRTDELRKSIMFEADVRSRTGDKYIPKFTTDLDGNIALAKEIIARHSTHDIQLWQSGEVNHRKHHCVLNAKLLGVHNNKDVSATLEKDLVRCFSTAMKAQLDNDETDVSFYDAIDFELQRQKHSNTFKWIKTQSQFILNEKLSSEESKHSSNSKSKKQIKVKQPYPAVDQRLTDLINSNLQVVVNKEIEKSSDKLPEMPDETKVQTFVFKLVSEFLLRNKGWLNQNSFTSHQHLMILEDYTGLKSKPSESYLTFLLVKAIIENFREVFKSRYPKVDQTIRK